MCSTCCAHCIRYPCFSEVLGSGGAFTFVLEEEALASLPPSPRTGLVSPGSPLFSGRARGNAERSTVCAVCIRSHDGGIPGKKALPLHAFVTAKNVHSGRLGIHDPTCVCQGPMAEAELIIPKREEGRERKGERGTRTHAISRFAIVGESLLLLDPGSFHLRRSLFDSRPRGHW